MNTFAVLDRRAREGDASNDVFFGGSLTMEDVLTNPLARLLNAKYKEIGEAYGLPIADAVALVKTRVAVGKATPDQLRDARRT